MALRWVSAPVQTLRIIQTPSANVAWATPLRLWARLQPDLGVKGALVHSEGGDTVSSWST